MALILSMLGGKEGRLRKMALFSSSLGLTRREEGRNPRLD
jgi:hypothetical protein